MKIKSYTKFISENFTKKQKISFIIGIIFTSIYILMATSIPYLFKTWINDSFEKSGFSYLILFALALLIFIMVSYVFDFVGAYYLIKLRESYRKVLREKVLKKILKLKLEKTEKYEIGYLSELLLSDVDISTGIIVSLVYMVVPALISFPMSIYWGFKLSYIFSIVGILGFIAIFILIKIFAKILRKLSYERQESYSNASAVIQETLSSITLIKVNKMFSIITGRNNSKFELLKNNSIKKGIYDFAVDNLQNLITSILEISSIFLTIYLLKKGNINITPAGILTGVYYLSKIWSPATMMAELNTDIQESLASIERINKITDTIIETKNSKKNIKLTNEIQNIKITDFKLKFNGVKFKNKISIEIMKGNKYGFQGESGIGKTSIVKVLLGLYDHYDGEILYDGINIREIDKTSILDHISYMPQEVSVFREDIYFNIALDYKFNRNRINEILNMVNLNNLKDKNYLNNNNLSGGEKKRIGIARILYLNKEIVIFDEPFSGLDIANKNNLFNLINSKLDKKILIIISHDDKDLKKCDYIYNFNSNNMVEF